jgi:hypothetical protein
MPPERLIITPIPALVVLLLRAEDKKGEPLTREEVESIRDNCTCVALPESAAAAIAERRGYDDLDLKHAWDQWQTAREQLRKPD